MAPIGKQEIQSPYICASKEKLVTNGKNLLARVRTTKFKELLHHIYYLLTVFRYLFEIKGMTRGTLAIIKW